MDAGLVLVLMGSLVLCGLASTYAVASVLGARIDDLATQHADLASRVDGMLARLDALDRRAARTDARLTSLGHGGRHANPDSSGS